MVGELDVWLVSTNNYNFIRKCIPGELDGLVEESITLIREVHDNVSYTVH